MKDHKQHSDAAPDGEVSAALAASGVRCPELTRLEQALKTMRLLEWRLMRSKAARVSRGTRNGLVLPDDAA
ncbi:MAG TPA: hypothetical protein VES20_06140 [Bryobacteraceae bacterium]|nr:hypothetical protein [Bryobacteraceae bacterium]